MRQVICGVQDLPPGGIVSGKLGPMPIVVVRTEDGRLYGMLDKCLHMGGLLSKGKIYTAQDGDECGRYVEQDGRLIIKCPWHGYEYDLQTGATMFDENLRLRTFTVTEEDGHVVAET